VIGILEDPGLHILPLRLGISFLGKLAWHRRILDMRLDQQYLPATRSILKKRSMGVGIWYEMYISDPFLYLFKNADPRGSLVPMSASSVRSLSNMPLDQMLVNRHAMSKTVREKSLHRSHEWGYKLGRFISEKYISVMLPYPTDWSKSG